MNRSGNANRPSFFIAGHSKCGTTALAHFLRQHPELFVCAPEEPNYFCPSWCRAEGPPSIFYRRSEAEYLELFSGAEPGQRCGEASAVYLYASESPALIRDFDPQARIIMIFREPVDFLRSYHLQLLKNPPPEGETVRDLAEAIRLEPARAMGRDLPDGCLIPELLRYSTDRIRYDEHFDRFANLFPAEQILPLVYDDFRADNLAVVRQVYEFLGVDPGFEPVLGNLNTGGKALRSRRVQSLLHGATHGSGAIGAIRRALPRGARKKAIRIAYEKVAFEDAPAVGDELAERLRAKATPHVDALGERLQRDLMGEWGYADRRVRG